MAIDSFFGSFLALQLVGDWEAAEDVQLCLPETGVCGVNFVDANELKKTAGCCSDGPDTATVRIEKFSPVEKVGIK